MTPQVTPLKPRCLPQDTEASALAVTLQQSLLPALLLETLPKSQIDLFLTVLESDGWDGDVSMCVSLPIPDTFGIWAES